MMVSFEAFSPVHGMTVKENRIHMPHAYEGEGHEMPEAHLLVCATCDDMADQFPLPQSTNHWQGAPCTPTSSTLAKDAFSDINRQVLCYLQVQIQPFV